MSFLNPFFLLGLAALAAPVLVHLVRRTRARRVEFPALLFVRQVPQRTIRRRTLHNLLLLLLRCLALLLVVFAFTRPFFTGAAAFEAEARGALHTVILLDASLSMRHKDHFAEARRRAEALVGEAQEGERVALMTFADGYEVVSGFDADRTALRASLGSLGAGFGATDYEQALRGADSLLAGVRGGAPKRVLMLSDFQASGWDAGRASFKLAGDVRLALIDVGGEAPGNVAVTNVEARGAVYGQKYADRLAVHVSNFDEAEGGPLTLDFQINDQTVEKRELTFAPREQKVVEFTGFNLADGPNRCAVRLRADDFAPDNEFYFTLRRETPAKALIIDGGGRGGDSFYLQSALAAGGDLPYTFDVRAASAVDPASVAAHSLLILNDAGVAPGALTESISRFVEAGGRLVIAAGPHTRAEGFNRAFERVAPAVLREAVQLRQGEGVAMTEVKTSHPVFEVFRDGARLPSARVFGYQRAEAREGADVLARFEDGSPALVESGGGAAGRVLLYTSTLGMGWSDLPLTPAYLPLVQQMVRHLGEREVSAWHRLGQAFAVAKGSEGAPPAVDAPSGARLKAGSLTPGGDMLLTGREPGFYRLRYAAGPDFAAVNVDGREGDFAKLNADEFLAAFSGGGDPAAPADAGERASAEETEARQRVWWPLLVAALLLLAAESLLSRRIKVAKMVG